MSDRGTAGGGAGAERSDVVAAGEGPAMVALTEEILPALIARLRASRLGELEVRTSGWRVRLRRDPAADRARAGAVSEPGAAALDALEAGSVVRSPAVGYFSPAAALVVGASVQAGDLLGGIDVLGVLQEVVAPGDGIIARVLVEDGQAVEYGQVLADVDPLELVDLPPAADEVEPVA